MPHDTIAEYQLLNSSERNKLTDIEKTIRSGSTEEKIKVAKEIVNMPEDLLYKLHINSGTFRLFCQAQSNTYQEEWPTVKNLDTGEDITVYKRLPDHHTAESKQYVGDGKEYLFEDWVDKLLYQGHYPFSVESIDNHERCTTLNLYIAAYLFKEYKELKNTNPTVANFLLDESCRLGLFVAIFTHLAEKDEELLKKPSNILLQSIESDIQSDADKLHNLYWTPGCLYACFGLIKAGKYLERYDSAEQTKEDIKNNEAINLTDAELFYHKAVENSCLAQLLEEKPYSKQINAVCFRGANIYTFFNAKSWDDVKKRVLEDTHFTEGQYNQIYEEMEKTLTPKK